MLVCLAGCDGLAFRVYDAERLFESVAFCGLVGIDIGVCVAFELCKFVAVNLAINICVRLRVNDAERVAGSISVDCGVSQHVDERERLDVVVADAR